jgi:hypothetical protein
LPAEPEPVIVKEKIKKAKKSVEATPELVIEPVPEPVVKASKHKKRSLELVEEVETVNTEPKKKKKKNKVVEPVVVEPVVEVSEKKKSKKRKLDDSATEEVKPKSKKLNILAQIEDPHHNIKNVQSREGSSKNVVEQPFSVPLASQKLKKVIPQAVEVEQKKRKKGTKKAYAEPKNSLPRPVWTTSGVFMEEPTSPYKFTSTSYVPIDAGSTKIDVINFEGKKKKKSNGLQQQQQQPTQKLSNDFKTQATHRNKKNRDGSNKNLHGLLGVKRSTS